MNIVKGDKYALFRRGTLARGTDLLKLGFFGDSEVNGNRTSAIINRFGQQQVQQLREMHIGFGALSCVMAFFLIGRIWYDSWRAQKLSVRLRPRRWAFLYDLHPAESFPLILGFIIFFQEMMFVGIQAGALQAVFVKSCRRSAQVVFTQIFIVGWFHMVFGLDMTIRSLRPLKFCPKRRYATSICVFVAILLTVATWASTLIQPPGNKCFGDMIFRSIKSSLLGVVLCGVMIPSFILMALIIGIRLYTTVLMDQNERIAGTRMVYYLILAAILYTMILPFWIQALMGSFDSKLTSSRVAEFVLFISGAVIALVHFFLRANAVRTAIKPSNTPWAKRRKFRLFGPSDLELLPISPPMMQNEYDPEQKERTCICTGKKIGVLCSPSASSPGSNSIAPFLDKPERAALKAQWPLVSGSSKLRKEPPIPPIVKSPKTPMTFSHRRNQASYSLFPGSEVEDLRLPPTVYSPQKSMSKDVAINKADKDIPHPSVSPLDTKALGQARLPWAPGHRRSNSADSSATVQIGIRFSAAPAALAASAMSSHPQRPSFMAVIDNTDPFANKPLPAPIKSPLSGSRPTLSTTKSFEQPSKQGPNNKSSPTISKRPSDYAWLDIEQSPISTSSTSSPSRPPYLQRQNSQRMLAESNRKDMAALERSGSEARPRPRPAYPEKPGTPLDNGHMKKGFF